MRTSPSLATLLAKRERLYVLDSGDRPDPAAAAEGVDVIVLDRMLPQLAGHLPADRHAAIVDRAALLQAADRDHAHAGSPKSLGIRTLPQFNIVK